MKLLLHLLTSLHGPFRRSQSYNFMSEIEGWTDVTRHRNSVEIDPSLTWGSPRLLHCTPIIQMR